MNPYDLPVDDVWSFYDWEGILTDSNDHIYQVHDVVLPRSLLTVSGGPLPPGSDEIIEIVARWWESPEGYSDRNFIVLVRLDGFYCWIEGNCDTTGWDCRAHIEVHYGSLNFLLSSVMTREQLVHLEGQLERPQTVLL